MFLLVPAYPGCPGSKAVKRSSLLLLLSLIIIFGTLSFVFKSVLGRPGEQSPNNLWAQSSEKHLSGFPGNVFHEAMSRAPITEHQFT